MAGEVGPRSEPHAPVGNWRARLPGLGLTLVLGLAAGLLSFLAFASLAEDVATHETQALDLSVLLFFQHFRSPTLDVVAQGFSDLGETGIILFLVVGLLIFAWQRHWAAAMALALATGGAELLDTLLKDYFQRARPLLVQSPVAAQAYSFPSGHAMVSIAFYLCLAYLGWRVLRGWLRVALAGGLILLILAIGVSRLYLGVHYFTDVVAGYLAGFFWVDGVVLGVYYLFQGRRAVPAPAKGLLPDHGGSAEARADENPGQLRSPRRDRDDRAA